jgi:hypothetical protein
MGSLGIISRTKYWLEAPRTYGDILFQPDPLPENIAQQPISDQDREKLVYYGPTEKTSFCGSLLDARQSDAYTT